MTAVCQLIALHRAHQRRRIAQAFTSLYHTSVHTRTRDDTRLRTALHRLTAVVHHTHKNTIHKSFRVWAHHRMVQKHSTAQKSALARSITFTIAHHRTVRMLRAVRRWKSICVHVRVCELRCAVATRVCERTHTRVRTQRMQRALRRWKYAYVMTQWARSTSQHHSVVHNTSRRVTLCSVLVKYGGGYAVCTEAHVRRAFHRLAAKAHRTVVARAQLKLFLAMWRSQQVCYVSTDVVLALSSLVV